ncbi:hypothetical protein P43SY_007746 [Pythium insidiosum]|uniref:VPS9 domain-containing protein n=1 Tax=Pythium insidiosum TaxID=114742 RepID=A0AAD5LGI5_PYTIN|nr:hypothetical protein P43SY_007746 [Pythium insidiosum]
MASTWLCDPHHGHSFQRVVVAELSVVQRSRLFLHECLACRDRILVVGTPSNALRRARIDACVASAAAGRSPVAPVGPEKLQDSPAIGAVSAPVVCQCVDCGSLVHRDCLSLVHRHRRCHTHASPLPRCPQPRLQTRDPPVLFPPPPPIVQRLPTLRRKLPSTTTIAALIEALADAHEPQRNGKTSPKASRSTMRRVAPLLAAGGVLGAIAVGPAAGMIAGLNVLLAGVTMESVVAGLGLTAATAAATATHQRKKKDERKRAQDEVRSGAWAMEICWRCKQAPRGAISDAALRKDAELLRRFQSPGETAEDKRSTRPTKDEVFTFLFGVYATPSELLSQANVELAQAFRSRDGARHAVTRSDRSRLDTLRDAKMYVTHAVGLTMQVFPSLVSTDWAVVCCTQAIERVVFDDVYGVVMDAVDALFEDENAVFALRLDEIRHNRQHDDQRRAMQELLGVDATGLRDEHLRQADAKLDIMMTRATSPLHKLELLCEAFRAICCFAENLHQTASNADILIPIVCALLIVSPRFQRSTSDKSTRGFVSQVAFTSYFTDGGGKGVEGYVLTTFQAAIQVIAAVDVSNGPAKELYLFHDDDGTESVGSAATNDAADDTADDDDDDEDFFDARSV